MEKPKLYKRFLVTLFPYLKLDPNFHLSQAALSSGMDISPIAPKTKYGICTNHIQLCAVDVHTFKSQNKMATIPANTWPEIIGNLELIKRSERRVYIRMLKSLEKKLDIPQDVQPDGPDQLIISAVTAECWHMGTKLGLVVGLLMASQYWLMQ